MWPIDAQGLQCFPFTSMHPPIRCPVQMFLKPSFSSEWSSKNISILKLQDHQLHQKKSYFPFQTKFSMHFPSITSWWLLPVNLLWASAGSIVALCCVGFAQGIQLTLKLLSMGARTKIILQTSVSAIDILWWSKNESTILKRFHSSTGSKRKSLLRGFVKQKHSEAQSIAYVW